MAKVFSLVDDLTGKAGTDVETRYLFNPFTGKKVEIDLSAENNAKLMSTLAESFAKTRPTAWTPNGVPSNSDRERNLAIRAWGKANGHEIGDRGRISKEIEEAYDKAMNASPATDETPATDESATETASAPETPKGRKVAKTS